MVFDWIGFLRQHRIDYTTAGPNASRGWVNIKCPFCADDPSEHLGISLRGDHWSCWRNVAHRGRSRVRLIVALLRCSEAEARFLAGEEAANIPSDQDLLKYVKSQLEPYQASSSTEVVLPPEFKPLTAKSALAKSFRNYLEGRGYRPNQIDWLAKTYDLRYCTSGEFAYRLIVPVKDRFGKLLTYTGRSILPDEALRYRTLSAKLGAKRTSDLLLGLPLLWNCSNPKALLICEGPFDALWITTFGRALGVYGTCLFGLNLSVAQSLLLEELRSRFSYQALLLDSGATFQAFRLSQEGFGLRTLYLPADIKDPAVLPAAGVIDLCLSVIP